MDIDGIVKSLLANRGITSADLFFHPPHPQDIPSPFKSNPAIKLIRKHIKLQHPIAIYGDYDVDGICSTAILWETLYSKYKNVFPHIPHREEEGYGLSLKGIDHCLSKNAKLIIAVDNGITAIEQTKYCLEKSCDLIIIDHHELGKQLPKPNILLHSTSACAAGLTWLFCRDFMGSPNLENLSLAAIATICDMIPLLETNRSIAKYGLESLNQTTRPGLLSLFYEARIRLGSIGTYGVGFIIGPRLNAMGRLEHAIDSLRLLCTSSPTRAKELAQTLNSTNLQRQTETQISVTHALQQTAVNNILLAASTSYHSGIIGLIAAKLVENYYRPSIAISIGEEVSKGSGRSITGFHLTDFLRTHEELFINLGGHAMACGFTISTAKIDDLAKVLATAQIDEKLLVKKQRIDLEIPLSIVNYQLSTALAQFEPFGLGNPSPVFQSTGQISDIKPVGRESKHIKFKVDGLDAIWFNATSSLEPRTHNLTYSLSKDTWNGQDKLQLVIKDVQQSS